MKGTSMTLSQRISQASGQFTASQQRVARYFLANESSVFLKTAAAIAAEIGVSESTIVRFAKAIGFESYTKMQKHFQQQYMYETSFAERLKQQQIEGSSYQFYETLIRSEADSMLRLIQPDFFARLDQAAEMIEEAQKIYVAGSRGSASVASHIVFNLNYLKPNIVSLVTDSGEWQDRMVDCDKEDLVIGICMPNYTQRTLDMMSFGKSCGAFTLALTDSLISPACRIADHCICCNQPFLFSPSVAITIANALLQKVAQSRRPEILARLSKIDQVLNTKNPYAG